VRSILTFALAVIAAALLWATLLSVPSQAQAGKANWSGTDTILFENHGYREDTSFKDTTGTIPSGATVYVAPPQNIEGQSSNQKLLVLYFAPGVDPPTATSVQYVEFNYDNGSVSNATNKRSTTLTPQGESSSRDSSCSVSGIGWIICPVSVFLADAMDNIFAILSGMIKVQPAVLGDDNNSMYIAWNIMRTIANIAFAIAFLIIIYSQLTNLAVSNYGLKRLVPRLIIAAILVNLSYIVTALAIDVSNIFGFAVQDLFNGIREQVFNMTNDNLNNSVATETWAGVTTVILAGGGTLAGGLYYAAAGGLYLLLPILVGLLLTIIFVVIILAARQAIILILVIISPLAFVAYLLPNTEKWFDKWKDLFFTMLIFFPAFSLVFGGSQLAGQLIIQNAGDNIVTLLFGMAVQIAPLVITPLILKLSGGLLGRIAQLTNDPRKGMLDRSRNWAERRAEHAKQQNIARGPRLRNPASWGASMVRGQDYRRRRLSDNTDIWKQEATNRYEETDKYGAINEGKTAADLRKDRIHSQHASHIDTLKTTTGSTLNVRTIEAEEAKVAAERASAQTGAMTQAYRAGVYNTLSNERLETLQKNMAENVIQTAAWKQSEQESSYLQQRGISGRMRTDSNLLDIAQGYGSPEFQVIARERAQANAVATLTKLNADARQNAITLLETEAVEAGDSVKDYAIKKVFSKANSQTLADRLAVSPSRLEAALEIAAGDGQVSVFDQARSSEFIDQTLVDAVVARHVGDMKSKGGFHIQADPQLSLQRYIERFNSGELDSSITNLDQVRETFTRDLNKARIETLSNTTSANLGGMKFGAFVGLADDIKGNPSKGVPSILDLIDVDANGAPRSKDDLATVRKIYESLTDALNDPSTRATMTDRLAEARVMQEMVRNKFFKHEKPLDLSATERSMPGGDNLSASMSDNRDMPTSNADRTDDSPTDEQDN
jgi:hypothetical protein